MGKMITLPLLILLTAGSLVGFILLTGKILEGEKQIVDGLKQLEKGEPELWKGRSRLEAGRKEESEGKKEYSRARDNLFLVWVDKLLNEGKGFEEAELRIAEGDKEIAVGQGKVDVGEKQIAAGRLALRQGVEQLRQAKKARVTCALLTVVFGSLSVMLGFRWRRSLSRLLMHRK
ncbi:MAG: hypothetical protein WAX69_12735 [Victivallales bacterium]